MEAATRELAAWVLSGENAVASVCKGRDLRLAASRCLSVEALQLHIMGYLAVGGEWCCSLVGAEGSGRSGVVQRLADVLRSAAPALRVVRVGGWKRRGSWSS